MLEMKRIYCLFFSLMLLFLFNSTVCLGEESEDIYIPLDAVQLKGTIDSIGDHRGADGDMIIDDMPYRFTPATEFLTAGGTLVSIDSFSEGQFVSLIARKSTLLKLWPEEREEGDAPSETQKMQQGSQQENGIRLENGVWGN